jgi:DNA-binding transcriptional ArsR family regulator
MSPRTRKREAGMGSAVAMPDSAPHRQRRNPDARTANTLAALGDRTRLSLLSKLGHGRPCSIAQLTRGSHLTRQAITKHLRVLERARIVRSVRSGRRALFELDPEPVRALRDYLDRISGEWDQALGRLKLFVEE